MTSCFTLSLGKGVLLVFGGGSGGFGVRGRLLGISLGLRDRRPGLDLLDLLALRTRP